MCVCVCVCVSQVSSKRMPLPPGIARVLVRRVMVCDVGSHPPCGVCEQGRIKVGQLGDDGVCHRALEGSVKVMLRGWEREGV